MQFINDFSMKRKTTKLISFVHIKIFQMILKPEYAQITYNVVIRRKKIILNIKFKVEKVEYICCITDPRIRPERLKNRPPFHSSPMRDIPFVTFFSFVTIFLCWCCKHHLPLSMVYLDEYTNMMKRTSIEIYCFFMFNQRRRLC